MKDLIAIYLLAVNAAAFLLCGWDKRCARRGAWRVPERTLLQAAFVATFCYVNFLKSAICIF